MKVGRAFSVLAYRLILATTLFFSIFIGIGAIAIGHSEVFGDILPSYLRLALLLLMTVMICLFVALSYHCLDNFSRRQLIISAVVLFGVMTFIYAVILCNFRPVPYTDALNLQDTAMYFVKSGNHSVTATAPHRDYFAKVSNNYFLTVLFIYFFKFLRVLGVSDVFVPLLLLAVVGMLAATVFMFLIGVRIGGLRSGVKLLLLCVINPIYYVLVFWVYTNVISIPFTVAAIYFGICIYQEKRRKHLVIACVLEAVCVIAGYFIRPTVVIPAIAFVICAVLWALGNKKRAIRLLKCSAVCVVTAAILFKGITALNESYFSEVSQNTYPVTHWLMMASHGDGMHNSADFRYTKQFDTKEERLKETTKKMLQNYREQSTTGLVSFFCDKLMISWSYGDGDDILSRGMQDTRQTKLYSWLLGDRQDLFRLYCYAFRIACVFLIIFALCRLLGKKEMDIYQFVFVLSFFGGIFFYCFWEVKGSYAAPFICIMLLIAMRGGDELSKMVSAAGKKAAEKQYCAVVCVVLACVLSVCLLSYNKMANTEITRRDWIVRCVTGTSAKSIANNDEGTVITQEFFASKPWNRIGLQIRADKESRSANDSYQMRILDEKNQEIYAGKIYAGDVEKSEKVKIETEKIIPKGKQKYTIQISADEGQKGKMYFQQRKSDYLDTYEGRFTLNGKEQINDLHMDVYMEYNGKWCSRMAAVIINGGIFLTAVLLYLWLCNSERICRRIRKEIYNEKIRRK